jgi:hypothetical protein
MGLIINVFVIVLVTFTMYVIVNLTHTGRHYKHMFTEPSYRLGEDMWYNKYHTIEDPLVRERARLVAHRPIWQCLIDNWLLMWLPPEVG